MSVRKAIPEDAEELRSVILSASDYQNNVDFSSEGQENFIAPNSVEAITKRLESDEYLTLCYIENSEILGLIGVHDNWKIHQLFVLAKAQKRGIARALWREAKSCCMEKNTMQLFRVFSSSLAVSVYESFGFRKTDSQQVANGISYYPMELKIKE